MTRNKKVTMVVWNDLITDARVVKEASTLSENGHDVTVVSLDMVSRNEKHYRHDAGFSVVALKNRLGLFGGLQNSHANKGRTVDIHFLRMLFLILSRAWVHVAMIWEIVKTRPNVVHAHDVNVLLTGYVSSILVRSKIVYDAHEISVDREGYRKLAKFIKFIESNIIRRVNASITTTDSRAVWFSESYQVKKPVVIQNRANKVHVGHASNFLRRTLDISDDCLIVLYQGGMQPGRGMHNLIKVAEKVKECHFVLIGKGRQFEEVQTLVRRFGIEHRVHILEAVKFSQLCQYTAGADIGIQIIRNTCLNHYTTDSNKLFEYIQAGLPVIASDFPEIRRVVDKYDVGLLVNPDNVNEISEAIRLLVNDNVKYTKYKRQVIDAQDELSWEVYGQRLVQLYEAI